MRSRREREYDILNNVRALFIAYGVIQVLFAVSSTLTISFAIDLDTWMSAPIAVAVLFIVRAGLQTKYDRGTGPRCHHTTSRRRNAGDDSSQALADIPRLATRWSLSSGAWSNIRRWKWVEQLGIARRRLDD